MQHAEAAQLVHDALAYAVSGDPERAADNLTTLGTQSDANLMYGACCALAEAGKIMLGRIYGDQMAQPDRGDMLILEELQPGALTDDPPKAFAARFLVAYSNGDTDTTLALWEASLRASAEEHVASVCALLADVAGLVKLALELKESGR